MNNKVMKKRIDEQVFDFDGVKFSYDFKQIDNHLKEVESLLNIIEHRNDKQVVDALTDNKVKVNTLVKNKIKNLENDIESHERFIKSIKDDKLKMKELYITKIVDNVEYRAIANKKSEILEQLNESVTILKTLLETLKIKAGVLNGQIL